MAKIQKSGSESVHVVVRCRPMDEKELEECYERVVDIDSSVGVVKLHKPQSESGEAVKVFTFDATYDWNSKQQDLYNDTFRPLVESVLEGFNGTIFAYGQTGTGKTFTMEGIRNDVEKRGVIPNSFHHIFSHIARSENQQYLVRTSYLEIYQEDIRDLLVKGAQKRHELKALPDGGVFVKDLTSFVCKSAKEMETVMNVGNRNRSVGATNMNAHSSRSHAIFIVTIECSEIGADGKSHIKVGKLNLVDLAGSERQTKTGAEGERLREASKINLALSALGNVIYALVDGKSSHIPYRDSKLTRLLQDSLGGNAKTVMVANIGPASYNYDETLTTLRYANRAKHIKNKPKVNEDPKDALLREFQTEIARLRAQLAERMTVQSLEPKMKSVAKMKMIQDGEICPEDDDSNESADENDTQNIFIQEFAELENERSYIENNLQCVAEEKAKLLQALQEKEEKLAREKDTQAQLRTQIVNLESKLLCGGKNIIDHTNEQQRALEHRQLEISEQKRREREMLQQLEQQEESTLEIRETFENLQQEVDMKTRKLRKLFSKLQAVKQEMSDITEEFNQDRRDVEEAQITLMKALKLRLLMLENFVPNDERTKFASRLLCDEEEDCWRVLDTSYLEQQHITKRPVSSLGSRRPVSEYARVASLIGSNPRYKGENIMHLDLEMPTRMTRDYEGPVIEPHMQAVLEEALNSFDGDIDIDAGVVALSHNPQLRGTRKPRYLKANERQVDSSKYPRARGLVPK